MELETLMAAIQEVAAKKDASANEVASIKKQIELFEVKAQAHEVLETKHSALEAEFNELKEQFLDMEAKGAYSMDTNQAQNINASLKSLAIANPNKDILSKGLTTTEQASAGVTIRTEYEAGIIKPLREMSAFLSRISHKVVSSPDFKRLVKINGAEMRWGGENVANSSLTSTGVQGYAEVMGTYGKAEAYPFITAEMLHDSAFDLQSELSEAVLEEIAVGINDAALNGDGVKKPKGLLNHLDGAAHEKFEVLSIGTAGALPVKTVDMVKALRLIQRSLKTGYRQNAVWIMNEEMRDALANYVYTDGKSIINEDLTEMPDGKLLGKEIVVDSAMPAGTFTYGDHERAFTFLTVEGMTVQPNPYIAPGNVQFYHSTRVGTIVGDVQAVKIVKIAV